MAHPHQRQMSGSVKRTITESFDRCVADKMCGYKRPKTFPIHFEWNAPPKEKNDVVTARCWNSHFWYGDGTPATEPSVIVRKTDFDELMRAAKRGRDK